MRPNTIAHPDGSSDYERRCMTNSSEVVRGSVSRKASLGQQIAGAIFMMAVLFGATKPPMTFAQTTPQAKTAGNSPCRVENIDYKGWKAQQLSNRWVQLVFVPQNG